MKMMMSYILIIRLVMLKNILLKMLMNFLEHIENEEQVKYGKFSAICSHI